MGCDTIMMEWRMLRIQLKGVKEEHKQLALDLLREHEEYMFHKGYIITQESVVSPQGVTLWKQQ